MVAWYGCEFLDGIGNSSGFAGVKLDPLKHVHVVCLIPGYSEQCSRRFFCLQKLNFLLFCADYRTWMIVRWKNSLSPSTRASPEKDKAPECLQLAFQKNLEIF